MIPLQFQALKRYETWLDLPYQAHLTVRLQQPNRSSQQLNRDVIRTYLAPLQRHCGTRLAAVTAIMQHHAHCLLVAPDTALDLQQMEAWASSFGLTGGYGGCDGLPGYPGGPKVTVEPIHPGTAGYDLEHLITQDGALHFFNKNHLNLKD